jgi:hypothetical protein
VHFKAAGVASASCVWAGILQTNEGRAMWRPLQDQCAVMDRF